MATLSMPGDATTLPLRDEPAGGAFGGLRRRLLRRRSGALATPDARVRAGAVALLAIVLLSLLIVILAADRPSLQKRESAVGPAPFDVDRMPEMPFDAQGQLMKLSELSIIETRRRRLPCP